MSAQKQFDKKYITSSEICNTLEVCRTTLLQARRSGRLPETVRENEFVLLSDADRACCHEAGRRLAAVMQASLDEGKTAPGVTARYRECLVRAVESDNTPNE